jgi:cytoskeletal protein CcmA (bactofilin family)
MFSKNSKGSKSGVDQQTARKPSPPSIISVDLKIVGDLSCEGEIQVDGSIDGDIRTQSLLVGETAQVKGEIVAETVNIHGNVNGQIKSRCVILAKTAHVVGDILHENLTIETGAFLEGHCNRMVENAANEGKVKVFGSDDANRRLAKIKEGADANADENKEDTKAVVSS